MGESNAWWRESQSLPVLEPDDRHLPDPLVKNPILVVDWETVEEDNSCTVPDDIRREFERKGHGSDISNSKLHNHYSHKVDKKGDIDSVGRFMHILSNIIGHNSRLVHPELGPLPREIIPPSPSLVEGLCEHYGRPYPDPRQNQDGFEHMKSYNGISISFVEGIRLLYEAAVEFNERFDMWPSEGIGSNHKEHAAVYRLGRTATFDEEYVFTPRAQRPA